MKIKSYLLLIFCSILQISFSQVKQNTKVDRIINTYVSEGNIYAKYSTGKEKQITYSGLDFSPFILDLGSKIVFIRKVLRPQNYIAYKICKVDVSTLIETVLSDKKPFEDGLNFSKEILSVENPTLSLDKQSIYFITDKWVTSGELVKVNLLTGKWTELFSAEHFEILSKDPYKNLFLVSKNEIRDRGRDTYYKLMDEKGKVLKEFSDKDSFNQFKKQIQ
jgi:hypothetical protein